MSRNKYSSTVLYILFSVLFTQAFAEVSTPAPVVSEVDASRWVTEIPEIGQRTYDLAGQKSEWVLGTSLMGNPDLTFSVMGLGSPTHRLPSKLAGLNTTRLTFDATQLNLNGDNGVLREAPREQPIDTPITRITWERFAFSGNSFGLTFQRLLMDSIQLDLGLSSHSNLYSDDFRYQDVTHQPYFALGRDSSSIPFSGRNIAMNSMHIRPAVTWYFQKAEISFEASFLNIDDDDVPNYHIIRDSSDYSTLEYLTTPFNASVQSRTYGVSASWRPFSFLKAGASVYSGTHEIDYDSLPNYATGVDTLADTLNALGGVITDTTWYGIERSVLYETVNGSFMLGSRSVIFNPSLHMDYEFVTADNRFEEDRELGYLQLEDTLGMLMFRTQSGLLRNSHIDDSVQYAGLFSANATLNLPANLQALLSYRSDTRFPDIDELRYINTGRYAFPNKNLKPEERQRTTADLQWDAGGLFYGLGIRHEKMEHPIRPQWVLGEGLDSIESAFKWINLKEAETVDWIVTAGIQLGNWQLHVERSAVLNRRVKLIDTPELFYKGSLFWSDRFVSNRLGVSVRWDFQWFDSRWDCEVDEDGLPQLVELKHYLALNFEARMQILTFELYTRIDNLNHSMYEPAAGYAPEGLRFLYGIVWSFDN